MLICKSNYYIVLVSSNFNIFCKNEYITSYRSNYETNYIPENNWII